MSGIRSRYTDQLEFFGSTSPEALLKEFGSPLYVYNENILRARCADMAGLFPDPAFEVSYSTKANGNPHLLRIIREQGLTADAMSPGELAMLHAAGFTRDGISYVTNNVAQEELALAARESSFVSVDSLDQLEAFGRAAPGGKVVVRVNPGIGAGHHQKVVTAGRETKFGVSPEDFGRMREILRRHGLTLQGLNQHVGSLFLDPSPYLDAVQWLLETAEEVPGLEILDFGGGFGIPYRKYEGQARLDLADFAGRFGAVLRGWRDRTGFVGRFVIEPGRYVVAECSLLLGTVHSVKDNGPTRFVGTDLGFNVLARPVMYDSFHDMEIYGDASAPRREMPQTIAGNICESGDVLAKDRPLPEIRLGDILGILDAGAYGHSMSSSYNQRFRPAEVLIAKDGRPRLIRRRETAEDLLAVFPR